MNTTTLITLTAAMLTVFGSTALAKDGRDPLSLIVPPQSHYGGKSHSEWLAAAEHWRFSIQGTWEDSPEYDADGSSSGINQQGPVFFLQYSWNLDPFNPVPDDRYATVRAGQAILADLDGWFLLAPLDFPWSLEQLGDVVHDRAGQFTEFLTLIIDGVEIPIDASMQSPWLIETAFELSVPDDSATMNLIGGPADGGIYKFAISEWIALIKPLPVGEHLIQIKGGNTGLAHPEGTTENIWWNWVNWHITVVP